MHPQRLPVVFAFLVLGLGGVTAVLFIQGLVLPGVLAAAVVVGLLGWGAHVM
jgi:hypothetical protein